MLILRYSMLYGSVSFGTVAQRPWTQLLPEVPQQPPLGLDYDEHTGANYQISTTLLPFLFSMFLRAMASNLVAMASLV